MLALQEPDPIRVRLAEPSDEEDLLDLCRAKHEEEAAQAAFAFAFSEEKARGTLQRALLTRRNDPDAGQAWCGVVGDCGRLEGSVYLSVQTRYDSDDAYLAEIWNWSYAQHRRGACPRLLIAFAQSLAASLKLPLVGGIVATDRESPKLRLLRRNGCQPLGSLYLFPAPGA
jgi:hypothetical protein